MNKDQFAEFVFEQAPMEFISELTGEEIWKLEELDDHLLFETIHAAVSKLSEDQVNELAEEYAV